MQITEAQRRYAYGIAIAAAPILVGANLLTGDQADLWLNLVAAVLLLGSSTLAVANVGKEPEKYTGRHRLED